jgi:hypothetical protein
MAKIPESEIYKYLTEEKNIPHKHAIGMITNIAAESEFDNSIYEKGVPVETAGIGLFQYTFPARRKEFIKKVPNWETDWKAQIDFALSESETKSYLDKEFDTEADAVKDFTINWERPVNKEEKAKERAEVYLPKVQTALKNSIEPIDRTLDRTAEALGLPTSEDLQSQLYNYNAIKEYEDLAASDPNIEVPLPNQNYDPNKSISEQYLGFNPELSEYFQGADNIPSVPINTQPASTESSEDLQTKVQAYNDLKSYDDAVAAGQADFALANPNYDPDRPQAEQYLNANPDIRSAIEGASDPSIPSSEGDVTSDPTSTGTGNTGRASGYEGMSAEELQGMYQGLLDADAAAAAGDGVYPLINQDFEPGPQAPQFLERRMQGVGSANPSDANFVGPPEMSLSDPLNPNFVGPPEAPDEPINPEEPEDPVNRNMLSKLKGQDYMGMLSDIGGYAARMAPLQRALRDASSYDEERYPRFAPIIPTATLPKRDVRDAFATAQQAAMQQGRLDLGALSALATQQAKETARVEENVANERVGLINQAQQINNQLTMQEMADTAANKGAADTMKYQALAAMSQMGQGSLREANMRRNDANVKNMFENVFGDEFGSDLKDKYSNA